MPLSVPLLVEHQCHGMNAQVIAAPDGRIPWTSGAMPGRTPDLTAACLWHTIRALATTGLIVLADKAYQGAGNHITTPYKSRNTPRKEADKPLSRQALRTRRTRERPAQIMSHSAPAALQPRQDRPPGHDILPTGPAEAKAS